jgi:hypothetical protein
VTAPATLRAGSLGGVVLDEDQDLGTRVPGRGDAGSVGIAGPAEAHLSVRGDVVVAEERLERADRELCF